MHLSTNIFLIIFGIVLSQWESVYSHNADGIHTSKYYNTVEIKDRAVKLKEKHPNLVDFYSIGKSVEGRELLVIKLSENVANRSLGEPMFKCVYEFWLKFSIDSPFVFNNKYYYYKNIICYIIITFVIYIAIILVSTSWIIRHK